MNNVLNYIGSIQTPFATLDACPHNIHQHQSPCRIQLEHQYKSALTGLAKGQPILILYWLEQAKRDLMLQSRQGQQLGTFALRSPHRPNPIGAAILPIAEIGEDYLIVRGLDCLNGTPLLDIKPAIYQERNEI